ncbi:hypothetical protein WG66_014514 [Moniliophthora roreri]|nr:hypothetical protein WG66_014514 [Moniliophthora roreri]
MSQPLTEIPAEDPGTRRISIPLSTPAGSKTIEHEEEFSPNTLKPSDSDTLNISTESQEELDPFQQLLRGLKNSPRSPKIQTEIMAEDKKPSGSRPKKEEPEVEEAVIGSAMPVQVVSAIKKVKAVLPRAFTGARKDAKKFLREVLIYVALNPKAFPDDRTKKLFLLSYITDGPREFWKNDKTNLLLAYDADAEKVTWTEFLDDFRTSFEPLDPALKAQLELKDLRMKERADEYTYQFTYLVKQTGYNDAAQIVAFKRGLPRSLALKIMTWPEASSTNSDDEPMGTGTPVPTSTTLGVLSPDSPLNPSLPKPDSPSIPIPPPNLTTPSFILTPLPIPTSNLRSNRSTPSPPLSPDLRPPLTPEIFRRLRPQFHQKVEHIPAVGGKVVPEEAEDEDEGQENRIPENVEDPPILSLRSPTPMPTPMTQLVDCVSALCVDWSAISPGIARSTCVADASKLSLDIHLVTAPTNEGLAALRAEGLIRAQTLCRMVTVMTMNSGTMTSPTRTSAENVERLEEEYDRDVQLLFVGADPQKVRMLLVEKRQAMGWQPVTETPDTPRMEDDDEMPEMEDRPDMSYDYNTELYGDGES